MNIFNYLSGDVWWNVALKTISSQRRNKAVHRLYGTLPPTLLCGSPVSFLVHPNIRHLYCLLNKYKLNFLKKGPCVKQFITLNFVSKDTLRILSYKPLTMPTNKPTKNPNWRQNWSHCTHFPTSMFQS